MSDTETLSNQLNNLFNDLRKIKAVKTKLSLHMYIDNATDDTTEAFTELMLLIEHMKIPDMELIFEDVTNVMINQEEMARS